MAEGWMGKPDIKLAGYRGNHRPPTKGTPLRAAYDAAHARWCGTDCPCGPNCREWQPDVDELVAALAAYEAAKRERSTRARSRT